MDVIETHPIGSWFVVMQHPDFDDVLELAGPFVHRAIAERAQRRYLALGAPVTVARIVPIPTTKVEGPD